MRRNLLVIEMVIVSLRAIFGVSRVGTGIALPPSIHETLENEAQSCAECEDTHVVVSGVREELRASVSRRSLIPSSSAISRSMGAASASAVTTVPFVVVLALIKASVRLPVV